jgi:hypothetical protein
MAHKINHNLELRDEHYTPKWIFDSLAIEFDLDVASPIDRAASNVPSIHAYTSLDDGLTKQWFGTVWMNPPYSAMTPWANKFREHANGICLVPVSRSKWFWAMWESADATCIAPHNLKFDRIDEKPKTIAFATMFFAFGDKATEALTRLGSRVR